ncbi:hypothetical protein [Nocardia sp. NPDC051832]|uniref:hypothetical protein n=1 Tax=Nocardia sp. NPDC051832 TaxID=3155673 RepID=UPI00343ACF33
MSDPAYLVLVDGADVEIYCARYGASRLEFAFCYGLESILRELDMWDRVADIDDYLAPTALLDLRNSVLVFFSATAGTPGEHEGWSYNERWDWNLGDTTMPYAYRATLYAVLEHAWPGWRVQWAYNGFHDFADYLPSCAQWRSDELSERGLRVAEQFDARLEIASKQIDAEEIVSLITIAEPGKPPRAYTLGTDLLELGPALVPLLAAAATVTELAQPPRSGLHLDLGNSTAAVWSIHDYADARAAWSWLWPDWQLESLGDRYERQLARGPADLFVLEPDLDTALEYYRRRGLLLDFDAVRARLQRIPHWPPVAARLPE